jgi:hypothetical protein
MRRGGWTISPRVDRGNGFFEKRWTTQIDSGIKSSIPLMRRMTASQPKTHSHIEEKTITICAKLGGDAWIRTDSMAF